MEALLEKEGTVESWNDERMDELARRMDKGFEEAATKVEMNLRFDRVDERFDEVDARLGRFEERFGRFEESVGRFEESVGRFEGNVVAQFTAIHDRLDRLNQTVLVGVFGLIAAVVANGIWG